MKTLLAILAALTLSSCGVMNKGINNHYILYNKTKAFFVLEELKPHKLIIENAQGTHKFRLYDYDKMFNVSDTIIVKDNPWVFGQLKFIKNN